MSARVLGVVMVLSFASGSPPNVEVRGDACEGPTLEQRIDDHLRRSDADPTGWSASASLSAGEERWTLELTVTPPGEEANERRFEAESCATVLDAAAFVLAIAIDPSLSEDAENEPTADEEAVPAPSPPAKPDVLKTEAEPPASGPSQPPAKAPPRVGGLVRGSVGVMGGALPAAGALFTAMVGVRGRGWRAEVLGGARLRTTAASEVDPEASGRLGVWMVGARGCGVPFVRSVEFPLCAGVEAGQIFGRGFGFAGATTTRVPWIAAVIAPAVAFVPIPRIAIVLGAEAGFPFHRAEFVIEGLETVHTVGPVFGRGYLAVEVRFP